MTILISIFILVLLFTLAVSKNAGSKLPPRDLAGALAMAGFGLAKLGWMTWPVLQIHLMCTQAAPEARNGWSAFMGMVSFALLPWLVISGVSNLVGSIWMLYKREASPWVVNPFGAKSFVEFWTRWAPPSPSEEGARAQSMAAGAILLTLMVIYCRAADWPGGLMLWVLLQGGLILLDMWLVRQRWWTVRTPALIRMILVTAVSVLSLSMVYAGEWHEALQEWTLMVRPPADTLSTMLLDQRLTTTRVCWVMWLSVPAATLVPALPWWLAQGRWARRLAVGTGLFLLVGQVSLETARHIPGTGQQIAQETDLWFDSDGRNDVSIGKDGWLYPQRELDRFTQRRTEAGMAEEVVVLGKKLKKQGAALLLIPVPDKLWLYPEPILPAKYWHPIYPPGYKAELKRLREAGVDVLDLTDTLLWDNRERKPLYFQQDSNWRAEAMKELAVHTARHIRKTYPDVVRDETPLVEAEFIQREDIGDLARALTPVAPERHWSLESTQMVGLRGLKDAETPILVMGGSLTRIYDAPGRPFGPAPGVKSPAPAGWPTQLGALLGRRLERAPGSQRQDQTSSRPKEKIFIVEPELPLEDKKLIIWVVRAGEL